MQDEESRLWQIIQRIDFYIETINSKASLMLAYCAALIFGLSVNFDKIKIADNPEAAAVTKGLITICITYTIYASYLLFTVVAPNLSAGNSNHDKKSLIFFSDIKNSPKSLAGYRIRIKTSTEADWLDDIVKQIHIVSCIADNKFNTVGKASKYLIYLSLIPASGAFLIMLYYS